MYYLLDLERSYRFDRLIYWKENRSGYTPDLIEAGLYPEMMATQIVKDDIDKRTIMIDRNVIKELNR